MTTKKYTEKYAHMFHVADAPNSPRGEGCEVVRFHDIFMPFDVIRGLDYCPPDNYDYDKFNKKHWWVCPKTKSDIRNLHDAKVLFPEIPDGGEFKTLELAIKYCFQWREKWLEEELEKTKI